MNINRYFAVNIFLKFTTFILPFFLTETFIWVGIAILSLVISTNWGVLNAYKEYLCTVNISKTNTPFFRNIVGYNTREDTYVMSYKEFIEYYKIYYKKY